MKLPSSGLITFMCLASLCMEAKEPIRTFPDAEGREIKARIHNTDGQIVLLETEDGQGFKTTIEVFSLEDQDYIRNWEPSPPQEAEGPELDESEAEMREGTYYKIGSELPHTGVLVSKFVDDTLEASVALSYGAQHGPTTMWYDTGAKKLKAMYRNGVQHDLTSFGPRWRIEAESAYALKYNTVLQLFGTQTARSVLRVSGAKASVRAFIPSGRIMGKWSLRFHTPLVDRM